MVWLKHMEDWGDWKGACVSVFVCVCLCMYVSGELISIYCSLSYVSDYDTEITHNFSPYPLLFLSFSLSILFS